MIGLRDRVVMGLRNLYLDVISLALVLLSYLALYNVIGVVNLGFVLALAAVFMVLAFLRGFLVGTPFVYSVILGEAYLVTYLVTLVPREITYGGALVELTPLIYFLWGVSMSWLIYLLVDQFRHVERDP